MVGDRKGRWLALVVLAVLVSGMEALGAGLVFVLISLVTDPDAGLVLPVIGDVSDQLPDVERSQLLVGAAVAIALFFVIRGVLQVAQTYAQYRITFNAGAGLSTRLVRGYMAMPYEFHLRRDSAELVRNAVVSVGDTTLRVLLPATKFLAEILVVAGITIVLLATAPLASLLVVAILGPATYLVLRLVKSRVQEYGHIAKTAAHDTLRSLQQGLHGFRDIRVLGRERYFVKRFGDARRQDARAKAKRATYAELTSVSIETLLILFIVGFVVFTVAASDNASSSLALLGLFAYAGMRLKPSIQKIVNAANNLRFASPAIDDLYEDFRETEGAVVQGRGRVSSQTDALRPMARSIEVKEVGFTYQGSETAALSGVNVTIEAGQAVGICGPTGGGKSTLADIITGLLEPTTGSVLVDGVDISSDLTGWHEQIGLVSQDPYLFDETIRRNVALGLAESQIDDEAVRRSLEVAQVADFVDTLPDGVETQVGEHGILLSGGQKQRIAIARALYRDPKVLILDEGTSALDNETEREFISALENLRGEKTIILIAHRLSTIQQCDRVLFVRDGIVSGGGTYEELYAESDSFRQMAL